jgi:uncharacterized OB-fold protein
MAYLPQGLPIPEPTIDDAPFWEFCRRRELRFQRCGQCGAYRHPPKPFCSTCRSTELSWDLAPSTAELFTYTWLNAPSHPAITPEYLPYNVAVFVFRSMGNVILTTNIRTRKFEDLQIGRSYNLVWDEIENGIVIPRFDVPE